MIIRQFNDLLVVAVSITRVTDRPWLAVLIFFTYGLITILVSLAQKNPTKRNFKISC